jgi:GTP-binding protein EngB required for normal cell division
VALWNKLRTMLIPQQQIEAKLEEGLSSSQAETFAALSQAIEQLGSFPELQALFEQYKQQLYRPLQVAIVGEYNAGKSTFLNAVLQDAILPTGDLPTTGCVNYIRYGNSSLVAHYKDGSSQALELDEFKQISTHNHNDPNQVYQLQQLKYIEVFKPAKILEEIVFVDTPGLNAPTVADREITEELLSQSDAIVWLTSARQVLAASEVEILETFSERYQGKSLCVISQIDDLNNPRKEVPKLLKYAQQTLSDYFADIVAVSALEAINGNEEKMRPFYKAFWLHIVPRSQEIVAQSILLNARGLIDEDIKDFVNRNERLYKLHNSLAHLQQNAVQIANQFLRKIESTGEDSARQFRRLQDKLITYIQKESITWTDYEPYTHTIEGIFYNDYVVRYREIERWKWADESVEQAHEWIAKNTENIMEQFIEHCQQAHQQVVEKLDEINVQFKEQNQDILGESDLNTTAQYFMIVNELRSFIDKPRYYFWGAMNHGGVYPISWMIFLDKSTSRPTASRTTELVSALLPLERLINVMTNTQDFGKAIQVSVNECYEWLENNISKHNQQIIYFIEELEKAKKYVIT